MFKSVFFVATLLCTQLAHSSLSVSAGVLKNMNTVQDRDGKETSDPAMPMVKVGYTTESSFYGLRLSPHFFWAASSRESNDSFGGDYSVRIYGFLYDLIYPLNSNLGLRFGLGNVIKKIEGEGGAVTVPNGFSTTTAYRPGEASTSYTGTVNLGFDYIVPTATLIKNLGLRGELLVMSPLKNDKRAGYLILSLQGYF